MFSQKLFVPEILRNWDHNVGFAHSADGMHYQKGAMVIPQTGRYYVYSQLYFQVEDNAQHMIHFVLLNRTVSQQIIMRSWATRCLHPKSRSEKSHFYSSYQGGVFELQNGDHIMVGVSEDNDNSISSVESASFFGAFMLI